MESLHRDVFNDDAMRIFEMARMAHELAEALKFYADLKNYKKETGAIHDMRPRGLERKLWRVLEFGDRAREALSRWGLDDVVK